MHSQLGSQVVSKDMLEKIMVVMKRHLTPSQVRAIIAELNEVPGNKSFRDTVKGWLRPLESEEGLDYEQV
jgi:hypothetical protein